MRPESQIPAAAEVLQEKYVVKDMIGTGGFGMVFSGTRKSDNFAVAIKFIDRKLVTDWGQVCYNFSETIHA